MPDKPPSLKQRPKLWTGKPGYEHYGEPGPVRYPDGLGKRVGGWLTGWLSALWR